MSIISFFKDAGEKLFGHKEAEAAATQAQATPSSAELQAKAADANKTAATRDRGLHRCAEADRRRPAGRLRRRHRHGQRPSGTAADQATKEKIVLCCGNVHGVDKVNDLMTVSQPADESKWHTVVKGDTLSAIAKTYLGNASAYPKIFEANKPMLSDPDKIYPGQLLRIPAA